MTAFTVIRPRLQRLKVLFYIYEKTCQFDMSVRFILADSNTSESFR